MKRTFYALVLILAAFFCGLAWNSHASVPATDCGENFECNDSWVMSTKPFIANAGISSSHPAFFYGNFFASGGGNSINVAEYGVNMQGASGQSAIAMDWQASSGVTAIGSINENGNATYITIDDVNQLVTITNLPTSDPHVVGALYNVNGVLHVSGG